MKARLFCSKGLWVMDVGWHEGTWGSANWQQYGQCLLLWLVNNCSLTWLILIVGIEFCHENNLLISNHQSFSFGKSPFPRKSQSIFTIKNKQKKTSLFLLPILKENSKSKTTTTKKQEIGKESLGGKTCLGKTFLLINFHFSFLFLN